MFLILICFNFVEINYYMSELISKFENVKKLQTQYSKIRGELDALQNEISNKQREFSLKEKISRELLDNIERLSKPKEIKISEHAILRYLERVEMIDLKSKESKILSKSILELIEKLGPNGTYPNKEGGFSVKLKDNVVVTILKK